MHSKSDNIETMINDEADEFIATGKINHFFFRKFALKKTGPYNADWLPLLVDYWETELLWQNYVILHLRFIYTKHINQTKEVQGLSVMMNEFKEVIRYRDENYSSSFQQHVRYVRLWRAVFNNVKVVFLTRKSHIINCKLFLKG